MLSQSTFIIPQEFQDGLASGDLIQWGGIIRDKGGHIVKHLKEVQLASANETAAARLASALKTNPRVCIPALVVGAAAVGGVAFAASRKRKQAAVPECVRA